MCTCVAGQVTTPYRGRRSPEPRATSISPCPSHDPGQHFQNPGCPAAAVDLEARSSPGRLGQDVGVLPALPDRHDHPAPIGVGPVHGALDQRRVDHRLGHALGLAGSRAALTFTWMTLVAPSPSAASCTVNDWHTPCTARSSSSTGTGPAAPLASNTAESEVDVSVSMERELNVASTTGLNIPATASAARPHP